MGVLKKQSDRAPALVMLPQAVTSPRERRQELKRTDCYDHFLDRQVFDILAAEFGTDRLTANIVDEIRVEAYNMMAALVTDLGPIRGAFTEAVRYAYMLRFIF